MVIGSLNIGAQTSCMEAKICIFSKQETCLDTIVQQEE